MIDAQNLTKTLGGRWHRHYGVAPCPICQPEGRKDQVALTLSDGCSGLLAHCKKGGCDFRDILAAAGLAASSYRRPDPAIIALRETKRLAEAAKRTRQAEILWQEAQPIRGSVAETYLRGRAITCDLPKTLRFHPACWHGATGRRYPALVALIEGSGAFAVHRTYLRGDGSAKADVDPAKAMLGAAAGGAVRLTDAPGRLVVCEGIETALSLANGLLRGPATVWAALSTSGLRGLALPEFPARLTIAPDGDEPGRNAGNALAERAQALGWTVSLLAAPEGGDWNDVLRGKAGTN